MMMTGTSSAASRTRSSTRATVMPCSSAVWVVRWIVGPSASGSEKGTPTSTKSAPAAATARIASSDLAGVGKPAVRYGMSARDLPSARHRAAMAFSDKVVADVDAVFNRVGDLDDGAREVAVGVFLREIDDGTGVQEPAVRGCDETHHRPVDVAHIGIRAVHQRDLVGVENDARADRVDPDQVDERLHDDGVVAAPRILPHLLEDLIRLDRHRLVHAPARRRVEAIGDRDDFRVNGQGAATDRLRIPGAVDLHVVLVGDDHAAVGDLAVAAQPEERQHPQPGVCLHDAPLLFAESSFLIQYLQRHARLADVVEQRRHAEIVQLQLGQSQLASQRDREDAHVDRVGERVFVVVAQRGQPYQGRLVIEHLVHDRLHRALHLLHVRGASHANAVDDLFRHRDRARIGALRGFLLPLLLLDVFLGFERRLHAYVGDAAVAQFLRHLKQLVGIGFLRCIGKEDRYEDLELPPVDPFVDADSADPTLLEDVQDVRERRGGIEVESQPRRIDEDEFALEADLELAFHVQQLLRRRGQIIQRLLDLGVLDRIELERPERGVEDDEEVAPGMTEEAVRRLDGRHHRGPFSAWRRQAPVPTSRSARLTALRTSGSLSCDTFCKTSRAAGVRILPSAIAAQARVSGSSFRASRPPLGTSSFSSVPIPDSPASAPYASKNAIFSVRSASLRLLPTTAASMRGNAFRWPRWPRNLTAVMRTSRSASSIAFSSRRVAPGLAMVVSASTSASFRSRSPSSSIGPIPSGSPGSFSRPASRTISSWTVGSALASALRTSAACACANRSAEFCTRFFTRSLLSLGSHPMSVPRASARSSLNSSLNSSSVGWLVASSSDCNSWDNASACDSRVGSASRT